MPRTCLSRHFARYGILGQQESSIEHVADAAHYPQSFSTTVIRVDQTSASAESSRTEDSKSGLAAKAERTSQGRSESESGRSSSRGREGEGEYPGTHNRRGRGSDIFVADTGNTWRGYANRLVFSHPCCRRHLKYGRHD